MMGRFWIRKNEIQNCTSSDYAPFGAQLAERSFFSETYPNSFNDKRDDPELGDWQDYGMRMYSTWQRRFVTTDPIANSYPWYTPYQFAGNNPIKYIDIDGLEAVEKELHSNVIIIIDEADVLDKIQKSPRTTKNSKNWTIIYATDIVDAASQIKGLSNGDNSKVIDNLVVRSHGSTSGLLIEQQSGDNSSSPGFLAVGNVQGYARGIYKRGTTDLTDEAANSIDALASLKDYIKDNGNVIFTGCQSGGIGIFTELSKNLGWNNINIYSNNSYGGLLKEKVCKSEIWLIINANDLQSEAGSWNLIKAGSKPDENGDMGKDVNVKIITYDRKNKPIDIQ